MKNIKIKLFTLACLFSAVTYAQNVTTFSFAADDTHDAPVFTFEAFGGITANAVVNLKADINNNNQGGLVEFQSRFSFNGELHGYNLVACGSNWLHVWKVRGSMHFHQYGIHLPGGLLGISFEDAVLTSLSPYSTRIGQTLTLEVSDSVDSALTFTPYTRLIGAGVTSSLTSNLDFAFTFTNARTNNQSQHSQMFRLLWTEEFTAEGSFSASGN